jgi:hypothetical protein
MWQDALDAIITVELGLTELIGQIRSLASTARALPFEPFREPVAILELTENGNNTVLNLDSWYLSCWCQHIAYSMRVRMLTLEDGILQELSRGRFLAAQVLLRAHVEAAAMAALCIQSLQKAKTEPEWDTLRLLIPKTLFGTSLFQKAKKDERLLDLLALAEQRTITICSAIDALDSFAFAEKASGQLTWLYALLCEASHPNHRGTKGFVTSEPLDDAGEFGWIISYGDAETPSPLLTQRLLESLLLSMRQGYAASELLRVTTFEDVGGRVEWRGAPIEDTARIWGTILQRSPDSN